MSRCWARQAHCQPHPRLQPSSLPWRPPEGWLLLSSPSLPPPWSGVGTSMSLNPLPFPAPQHSCSSRLEPSSLTPSLPLSTPASPAWPEASRPRSGLYLEPWAVSWGCSQHAGKSFCRPRGGSTQSCYCPEPHPRTLTPQHPQPAHPSWPARPVFPSHPWAAGYS